MILIHIALAIGFLIAVLVVQRKSPLRNRGNEVWPLYVGALSNAVAALAHYWRPE